MFSKLSFKVSLLYVALRAPVVSAVSLYIPGFDPQPVTIVSVLGVGSAGETTFLIAPGTTTGSDDEAGFFAPGPTTAEIIYNDAAHGLDLDEKCAINGDIADCTAVAAVDGITTTEAETVTVAPFEVQGSVDAAGSSAASATPSSSNAASTPSTTPSAGSGASSGPVATGSSSSLSPSPSAQSSGASAVLHPYATAFVGIVVTLSGLLIL
ncbi:hypothetical protein BC835DRAFT_1415961 [Cytidiella melzeri]|nr:hypothetical protein BC835DRAFT_1415961 [Cytidiella melzeri]